MSCAFCFVSEIGLIELRPCNLVVVGGSEGNCPLTSQGRSYLLAEPLRKMAYTFLLKQFFLNSTSSHILFFLPFSNNFFPQTKNRNSRQ